ncbi:MAG: 4'-phosphopantetheinyl transferase family protein, partial [Cyanobium sp.]
MGRPEHLHNLPHTLRPIPWTGGQVPPPLPRGTAPPLVLLLRGGAQVAAETGNQLLASLSPMEQQRHAAYRRPGDQARYLLARASLRQLLGHWLQQPAATIAIEADLLGKPRCPTAGAPAFNLSHSGDLILLAFHPTTEVGVDVEQARPNLQWERIAQRWLTPAEVAELRALPQAEQAHGFLAAWCRL